jgi:hypothetical protein
VPAGAVLTVPEVLQTPQIADRAFSSTTTDVPGVGRDIDVVDHRRETRRRGGQRGRPAARTGAGQWRYLGRAGPRPDEIARLQAGGRDMSGKGNDVSDWWSTAIIDMAPGQIRLRGHPIEELIGRLTFPQMIWLMTRGEMPSRRRRGFWNMRSSPRWTTGRRRPPSPPRAWR